MPENWYVGDDGECWDRLSRASIRASNSVVSNGLVTAISARLQTGNAVLYLPDAVSIRMGTVEPCDLNSRHLKPVSHPGIMTSSTITSKPSRNAVAIAAFPLSTVATEYPSRSKKCMSENYRQGRFIFDE